MKKSLVVHPLPYEYESLSNYIFRLKILNDCDIDWLNKCFSIPTQTAFDIYDTNTSIESMHLLSQATNLDIEKIKNMTLSRFDLWGANQSTNTCDNLLNHFNPSSSNYFCPLCIKETNYERIYWKLDEIKICLDHNVFLIDRCTKCGRQLTYKLFKDRACSCGAKLRNMIPTYVDNENILMNQRRFYMWYNIIEHTDDLDIKNLELPCNSMYISFISSLSKFVSKYTYYLIVKGFYNHCNNDTREFDYMNLIEELLSNWPTNLYKFLDFLNKLYIINQNSKEGLSQCIQSPTPVMSMRKFKHVYMIYHELSTYFYSSYNYDFFLNMLNPILINYKYIDISYVIDIFFIPEEYILRNFEVINVGRYTCVSLLQIIEFFRSFIKEDNLIKSERQTDLISIYNSFLKLGITLSDILNIIYTNHIEITIDIFGCGFCMLCVPKREVEIYILEYLLDQRKNNFFS